MPVTAVVAVTPGLPKAYKGEKVLVTGNVVGTTVTAGIDFKSMLCGPIRMTPVKYSAWARLIVNPDEETVSNGAVVPGGLVHTTCKLPGLQTWLPTPQVSTPGPVEAAPPSCPPAVCTDSSLLAASASRSGGADPKRVKNPLTHTGSPAAVPRGSVRPAALTEIGRESSRE